MNSMKDYNYNYYFVRKDKSVVFLETEVVPVFESDPIEVKPITSEEFILAKNGNYYLSTDLTSPEYLSAIELLEKNEEIGRLHYFLYNTDYIVSKIYEAKIEDNEEEAEQLKNKYADILQQRKQARVRLNELEVDDETN